MSLIRRSLDGLYLAGAWLAGALLVLMCLLVLWSILARLIGVFAGGATDVAGYVMATSTFMALAYTFRSHGHIRVSLVLQALPAPARRRAEIACLAVMSAVTVFLAYYMARLAYDSWDFQERSEGADAILLWIPQTPVAVGSALFALAVVHTFIEALTGGTPADQAEGPSEI